MFMSRKDKEVHTYQGGNVTDRRDGYRCHVVQLSITLLGCPCRWTLAIDCTGPNHYSSICLSTCLFSVSIMRLRVNLHEQVADYVGIPRIDHLGLHYHPHKGKADSL